MRVGVTGATGFVGRRVVRALLDRGHQPTALTRDPATARFEDGVAVARFNVNDTAGDAAALEGLDAIVHLAGETVDGRWTQAKKRAIFDSRVGGTRNLVAAIAACTRRPRALVSASAVGFFADRRDDVLDESSAPGGDFLASVCTAWERESMAAQALGLRVAIVRVSFAVGDGGAVKKLVPIFKAGLGGPLGSGRQWMPWIHVDDLADLFCFAVERDDARGPLNGVAPDYAQNARVMHAIGRALGRPALAPAPGFALGLIVGEFAQTLLGGQLIIPAKALDLGFIWRHPRLEEAMIDVLAPDSGRTSGVNTYVSESMVRAPLERVFAFFSDPANLARMTPPEMGFASSPPNDATLRRGMTIDHGVTVYGMRMRWRSLIASVAPMRRFSDVQVRGPYQLWRHTHEFGEREGGVVVRDLVEFTLPYAPLSDVVLGRVRRDLDRIFAYRRRSLEEIFAG